MKLSQEQLNKMQIKGEEMFNALSLAEQGCITKLKNGSYEIIISTMSGPCYVGLVSDLGVAVLQMQGRWKSLELRGWI
jgi:hypothetical protein